MSVAKSTYTTLKEWEYDVEEANDFIEEWKNLAFHISLDHLQTSNRFFGLDLMRSAALEACLRGYLYIKEKDITETSHIRGVIRMEVRRTFWSLARMFGYIPSRGQIYFPKEYVEFEDEFRNVSSRQDALEKIDFNVTKSLLNTLPEKKRVVFDLYIMGYDFAEISKALGYKSRSAARHIFDRAIEEIKCNLQKK